MGVVIRQSVKGAVATYAGAFIGFLNTLFIATHFLTPEEIGLQRILIEAATLMAGLSQLGVNQVGVRFFPYFKTEDNRHKGFFHYLCLLPVGGIAFFGFLYFLLQQPIDRYFAAESPLFTDYYFWVFPLTVFIVYLTVFETYGNVLMRITIPKLVREVGLRVFTAAAIVVYGLGYVNLNGFVVMLTLAYAAACVVDLLYALWLCPPRGGLHPSIDIPRPLRRDIASYSFFLMLGSLANLLILRMDVFMVSAKMGLEFTAIYSIAYYMAVIIEMPSRSTGTMAMPLIAEAYKQGDRVKLSDLYRKVALNQFVVALLVFLVLWLNIRNVYAVMPNGAYYAQGMGVVLLIALAKVIESVSMTGGYMLNYSPYYRYSLPFIFLLGGLTVATNIWLIPRMGVNGAALATLITVLVYAVAILLFVGWKIKIHPFSFGMLKAVAVVGLCCGLHALWPPAGHPIVDACVRTAVLGGLALWAVYKLKVSAEFNSLLEEGLRRIGHKNK
ncbi:MAG: oligosaccharide flippase family protein [Bacteroidales bacterium]|nr:oligosaccharide flippase family protein [Bacteroidales bacterium]